MLLTERESQDLLRIANVLIDCENSAFTPIGVARNRKRFFRIVQFKKPEHKKIGLRLREIRRRIGATLSEFGKVSGLSVQYLSALERGDREWNYELLKKYAAAIRQIAESEKVSE